MVSNSDYTWLYNSLRFDSDFFSQLPGARLPEDYRDYRRRGKALFLYNQLIHLPIYDWIFKEKIAFLRKIYDL